MIAAKIRNYEYDLWYDIVRSQPVHVAAPIAAPLVLGSGGPHELL